LPEGAPVGRDFQVLVFFVLSAWMSGSLRGAMEATSPCDFRRDALVDLRRQAGIDKDGLLRLPSMSMIGRDDHPLRIDGTLRPA